MSNSYTYPVDSNPASWSKGVGKSPLGDMIAQYGLFGRPCYHLDFGSELRGAVADNGRSGKYTAIEITTIHGVLERGLLLENEHFALAQKIFSLFLIRKGFSKYNVLVLNGIPRHEGQARDTSEVARVHFLVILECSAVDVFCRIRENIGRDRMGRADDHREMIEKKLVIFHERIAPLINYYERLGCKLYRINVHDAMAPADAYLKLSLLAAADPPVALVAKPPHR